MAAPPYAGDISHRDRKYPTTAHARTLSAIAPLSVHSSSDVVTLAQAIDHLFSNLDIFTDLRRITSTYIHPKFEPDP